MGNSDNRYHLRGVSAQKEDVHNAIKHIKNIVCLDAIIYFYYLLR